MLSATSALLLYLSFPPISLSALALFAFLPLLVLEEKLHQAGKSWRNVVALSSLSFLLANVLLTWWVKNAAWSGLISGALYNTMLMSFSFGMRTFFRKSFRPKLANLAWLSLWIAIEYLHLNHFELDFPWLILGHAFAENPILIQWYEFTGVLGGSFWILGINVLLFEWLKPFFFGLPGKAASKRPASLLIFIIVPLLWSVYRYYTYDEKGDKSEVVILQPNIDPYGAKFDSRNYRDQLRGFLDSSLNYVSEDTRVLIWPETSIPGTIYLGRENWQEEQIFDALESHPNLTLITGASGLQIFSDGDSLSSTYRTAEDGTNYDYYNCAFAYQHGMPRQFYIKSKLVIGVEKMPYISKIAWLKKIVVELGGTSGQLGFQEEREVFHCKDELILAPVICYESVYGQYVTDYILKGANAIAVMTNDGWWGNTPGYKQHFSFSRMRAIETRRDVVRSANTGISAVIDQKGEVREKLGYWLPGRIRTYLFANSQLTFYVKYGDYLGRFALIVSALLLCIGFVRASIGIRND